MNETVDPSAQSGKGLKRYRGMLVSLCVFALPHPQNNPARNASDLPRNFVSFICVKGKP